MTISELIDHLENLKQEHGNVEVLCIKGIHDWDELPVSKNATRVEVVDEYRSSMLGMDEGEKYVTIKSGW